MSSFRQVLSALGQHGPLGVYDALPHVGDVRWPYPPAYFPWVYASGVLASHGGPSLEFTIRLAPIAANLGIAFVVQDFLGRRGGRSARRASRGPRSWPRAHRSSWCPATTASSTPWPSCRPSSP